MSDVVVILKGRLKRREFLRIDSNNESLRHASVLIPLFRRSEDFFILFTKRTNSVEHHKGQISFPGGAVDPEDGSYLNAALREAREEIGLREKDVEMIGRIDDAVAHVSHFVIHPFVGVIPYPYDFKINKREVDRLIEVPLREVVIQNREKDETDFEFQGRIYPAPAYEYRGDLIWGATARILKNLLDIIGE